eukprot:3224610-Rhodomonas_salina.1
MPTASVSMLNLPPLLAPPPPCPSEQKSADKYGAVSIPTVFVSEDDGHDLRTWVWDHAKVTGMLLRPLYALSGTVLRVVGTVVRGTVRAVLYACCVVRVRCPVLCYA